MNINDQLSQGQKEYGVGSRANYYKFEKGDNRIRVLTAGEVIATHFFGKGVKATTCYGVEKGCPFHGAGAPKGTDGKEKKPSIKYTCYVMDRNDVNNKIQLADLPYSVIKQIGDYQADVDYSFESFPMPYDVTVKYNPDSNSPNDMYKVIASPKREEVSEDVKNELADIVAKLSPADSVKKKKEWQMNEHDKSGTRLKVGLTPEQIAEGNKISAKHLEDEGDFKYPEDDINPNDIPF